MEKTELNIVSETIRINIRERERNKKDEIIRKTLERNENIKKMKKEICLGKQWTTHFINQTGQKIYDRVEINKLITTYYKDTYSNDENDPSLSGKQYKQEIELEPEFLKVEASTVIKKLK